MSDDTDGRVITVDLREAIAAWDGRFQATYNREVPQDSGILDPQESAAFISAGWELAHLLRTEVPTAITVQYATLAGSGWVPIERG